MQVEHKTEKGTLRFELIPEHVIDVDLIYTPKSLELRGITKDGGWWYSDEIQIGFVKIGLTSEVTEEQAKMMVDDIEIVGEIDNGLFVKDIFGYKDYSDEENSFDDAIDSFKSILQHLKVYETNPYGGKPLKNDRKNNSSGVYQD